MSETKSTSTWNHSVIATHNNKVISITSRNYDHEIAGVLHKFLDVPLNTECNRIVNHTRPINYQQIRDVLFLFKDYNQYKEIDFLKVCLHYSYQLDDDENITLSFMNE